MHKSLMLAGFLIALPAAAEDLLKGEIFVTSNYVWRGLTLSDDAPSVIGGLDYRHRKGFFGSAHVANVRVDSDGDGEEDNWEQLALLHGGIERPWRGLAMEAGAVFYEYTRGDRYDPGSGSLAPGSSNKNDFLELFLGARYGNGRFRYYRSEDYLGSGKISNYYEVDYIAPLHGGARAILHYGFADSPAIDDHSDQVSDTAFGIEKAGLMLLATNLDDNEDGMQSRNARYVIAWHYDIDL